jgi:hypothetical protein
MHCPRRIEGDRLPDRSTSLSLGAELRRAAAEAPDRPFLRLVQREWTYREFDHEVDLVAAFTSSVFGRATS